MPKFLPPPFWLAISVVVIVALWRWLPGGTVLRSPWTLVGVVPIAVGIALGVATAAAFKRHKTTIIPFEISSALMTGGTFRFSRNPIYLSMVLLLIGAALLTGAATPYVVVVVFAAIIRYGFIGREEQMLNERFGTEYQAYAARVRRWL